jgi:hypothetical protein
MSETAGDEPLNAEAQDARAQAALENTTGTIGALSGELTTAPAGMFLAVLSVVSGVSLLRGVLTLAGRVALAYRRPAKLRLSDRGVEISHRVELLGRVLRDAETIIPLSNLASISREVRYARLGLYSGLFALVLGTYVGAGLIADGVRVPGGSPSLLGFGLAAIALGIVLDYALAVLWDVVRRTCRLVVTPRRGRPLCIQGLDPNEADRVLADLAEMLRSAASATTAPTVDSSP